MYEDMGNFLVTIESENNEDSHEIVFEINFKNSEEAQQTLYFSNDSGKAEIIGLKLYVDGARLEPVEVRHRNLVNTEIEPIVIPPNSSWTYKLIGKYENKILRFKGGAYVVHPRTTVLTRFTYGGMSSNELDWVAPGWQFEVVPDKTIKIIGEADSPHEISNAARFAEINGGGTFDFDGVKQFANHKNVEGVDGLYTFNNGTQTAVSLKSFESAYMSGVLKTIAENVDHIARTPFKGNTTIFADVFSRNAKQQINVNKVVSL